MATASTRSEGNVNTAARRRARRGERRARCRGCGAGILSTGFPLQPPARAGPLQPALTPQGRLQCPELGAASWAWGRAGLQRGCRALGLEGDPDEASEPRARRLPPTLGPGSRVPGPAPSSRLSPHSRSQVPVRGRLRGLQRRRLGAPDWLASPTTHAPASFACSPSAGWGEQAGVLWNPGHPRKLPQSCHC